MEDRGYRSVPHERQRSRTRQLFRGAWSGPRKSLAFLLGHEALSALKNYGFKVLVQQLFFFQIAQVMGPEPGIVRHRG